MSKQHGAPIEFDAASIAALNTCSTYLEEAQSYVQGERDSLPDPTPLLTARFPTTKLKSAIFEDVVDGIRWPTISVMIEDKKAENPRHFDPWYFVVMLLLELPGGRVVLDRSNHGDFFYAAYAGSRARENINLHRIIANTPIWGDTKHFDNAHHDCRRIRLYWLSKNLIRKRGQKTRAVSNGREDIIRFALDIFTKELARHYGSEVNDASVLPAVGLTVVDYEMLLRIGLHLADSVHQKYLVQSRDIAREPS